MSEWKKFKLEEIINDVAMGPFGSNLKVDNFISAGVPVIRGGNLNQGGFDDKNFVFVSDAKAKSLKRSLAYPDDLIFTHRGTIGQVGIIEKTKYPYYLVSQSQMRLTVNKQFLSPRYLFYWFKSRTGQYELLKNSSQVGVPAIASPTKSLREIDIRIPNLPTQTAIAEILSSLDDKIELNNKINQELETLAQILFKQWFIDFEFPNENGEPYKSSGGEMVESELGEIPKEWEVKSLCKELTIAYGKNLPTTKLEDSGYDVFGGNGIIGKYHTFLYEEPQVLIACRGAASGKINISNRKSFVTNNSLIIEYENSKIINFTYLKYWSLFQDFTKCVSGSAQPQITIENLASNLILVPDINIVEFFSKTLSSTLIRIDTINSENNHLVKLRDTILPKLISGELEINEINN